MARPSGEKTRNGGLWTESKFNTFIRNQLRQATRKWSPIIETKKGALVSRGVYRCNGCGENVPVSIRVGPKRVNNVFVDHIEPIVDPVEGFTTFDNYIDRMFCEKDNLQLLCGECHDEKSLAERALRAETRQKAKLEDAKDI